MRSTGTADQFVASLEDAEAACAITDPPWDLAGGGRFDAVADYQRQSVAEIADTLADLRRKVAPGGFLFTWAPAGPELMELFSHMEDTGWAFQRELCWRKGKTGLGAFQSAHEPVLVFTNGHSRGYEISGRYASILDWPRPAGRTAKPWQAYRAFLEMATRPGELAVDPYCGTNPLKAACDSLQPSRRWKANDILAPDQIDANTSDTVRKQSRRRQVPSQRVLDGGKAELFRAEPGFEDGGPGPHENPSRPLSVGGTA